MNNNQGFWFPSMKISEIVLALKEWGLRVSDDQIQRPSAEIVQSVYTLCVQQVIGITPEALEEPVSRAVRVVDEYPELYETSLNLNLNLYHIQRLAFCARVQDFSMRDLVFPEAERTRNILSAIINFIKFAEERGSFVKRLKEESMAVPEEKERIQHDIAELKKKITEIKKQREMDEPRCRILEEEVAKNNKAVSVLSKAKENKIKEVEARRKERSGLSHQRETIIRELEHVTSSINTTRSRIVQSPDRIRKQISEMTVSVQDERTINATTDMRLRELKTKLDGLSMFEQDMKKLIDDLRMVQSEHIQVENIQHKLSTFREELDRKIILCEQLNGRADRAKRQLRNAEDKLIRAQQHAENRRGKSEEEIARLKREYEEMSEERRGNDRLVEETKQEAIELEKKMQEHLKVNEGELNELLGEYWKLRHQTEVYMETLANKLGIELL